MNCKKNEIFNKKILHNDDFNNLFTSRKCVNELLKIASKLYIKTLSDNKIKCVN